MSTNENDILLECGHCDFGFVGDATAKVYVCENCGCEWENYGDEPV